MRRRVIAAAAAVGGAALVVRRPSDGRPSIADALALTPALPALVRVDRAAWPPVLESSVFDARSGARVALCGVCHVDPGSAAAACAAVARHGGNLGAVALEIDARTLAMVDAARQALDAAPADADREATVRAALSALPFAPPGGFSANVPLPPAIAQPLKQGVLYAREMAEAAAAAAAAGAPVHCLRAVQDSSLQSRAAQPPGPVAQLAVHLRAQALHDGAHPQSCARESVVAYEAATRCETMPRFENRIGFASSRADSCAASSGSSSRQPSHTTPTGASLRPSKRSRLLSTLSMSSVDGCERAGLQTTTIPMRGKAGETDSANISFADTTRNLQNSHAIHMMNSEQFVLIAGA